MLVEREAAVAHDGDAAIRGGDEVVPALLLLARQQRDVRHALELHVGPGLRVRAAMRPYRAPAALVVVGEDRRLLPRGVIVDEDSLMHDVAALGLPTPVIPAAGGGGAGLRPAAADVHERRPEAQRAEHGLRWRHERGARVIRLEAQRA